MSNTQKLKMDNLEKFILEHRAEFDREVPGLKTWANIDRELDAKKPGRIVWMKRFRMAAAAAVLVAVSCYIGFQAGAKTEAINALSDISPEHAEMERFFKEQINEKMARLASYEQDGFVRPDLQELDGVYEELKAELKNAPVGGEEKVIQAMINNYQTKLDILEQVLEQVNTTETTNLKTEENEISI